MAQRKEAEDSSDSESGEVEDGDDDLDFDGNSSSSSNESSYSSLSLSENEKGKKKDLTSVSLTDIERVKISRNFIERNYEVPTFDMCIIGCYVKINICVGTSRANANNGYLLGQITDVVNNSEKPYLFSNRQVTKYIKVTHANQEKVFSFNVISNSPISESEFKIWRDRMEKVNIKNSNCCL